MKKRDTEGRHPLAGAFFSSCGIYGLQGLLLDRTGRFTAAVEAYETEPGDRVTRILGDVIDPEEFCVKSLIAQKTGVPFYLLIHKAGSAVITAYQLEPDLSRFEPKCIHTLTMREAEFLKWWQGLKQTTQTKPYRTDFRNRVEKSYYDCLLESNGEKWGGNIDGIITERTDHTVRILGIVENRFTNKTAIREYDPNRYFHCGGGDCNTWSPLFILREILRVPLFLCTFSNMAGETGLMGVTRVEGLTGDGITYVRDKNGLEIKPCDNLFSNTADAFGWMKTVL